MATQLILVKMEDALHPTDEESINAIRQIPENSVVNVQISIPRNVRQLRLFFALLNLVFIHQREPRLYATREDLRKAITIATGHFSTYTNPINDQQYTIPDSIAFGSMDQIEWKEFFDSAKNFIIQYILPGVGSKDLEQAIADLLREPGPNQLSR